MEKKYVLGGFVIVVFLGVMALLLSQSSIAYENDFSRIQKSDVTIRATGVWVKEKGYEMDKANNIFTFYIKDNKNVEVKVVYQGSIPNNFETATSVVVTGKYSNGIFNAATILTKCPSKYEERFEENQS
ncbi:MAG: cytochrome c maturation protein CcmE [Rhodothermaceae bacterium]